MILRLTLRNLWRNPRRTLISLSSVLFAVLLAVVMKSFQDGIFDNLVRQVVGSYNGYVQLHASGYWEERTLENSMPDSDSLVREIRSVPRIRTAVPRIESFALGSLGERTRGCLVVGTDVESERSFSGLDGRVIRGRYLQSNERGVLVGEGYAAKLGIRVGDTLVLLGQGHQENIAAGKFPVLGLVHLGLPQLNDGVVYLPLSFAQAWLSAEDRITAVVIQPEEGAPLQALTDRLRSQLGSGYEAMTWQEMLPEIDKHIRGDAVNFYIEIGILYLVIAFGLFGTLLMMTNERRYEFGMLIAIGMKKRLLAMTLLLETLLLTFVGTLAGMLVATPLVLYLQRHPLRMGGEMAKAYETFGFEPVFPALFRPDIFWEQALIVLAISLVLGLYPIRYLHRLDPVVAMRR